MCENSFLCSLTLRGVHILHKVEILNGLFRIRGFEFLRIQRQKPRQIESLHGRRIADFRRQKRRLNRVRRQRQQSQSVDGQGEMDGVRPQLSAGGAGEESRGRFELAREEQDAGVAQRLLVGVEMSFAVFFGELDLDLTQSHGFATAGNVGGGRGGDGDEAQAQPEIVVDRGGNLHAK